MYAAVKTYRVGNFEPNPRGNLWAKDENKFGRKLLNRMGWSAGKGLGKNENGITESIKVRMKRGHSGVGWSEELPLGKRTHDYDTVLEELNKKFKTSNEKVESKFDGLEKRSQEFKNRLHYQKFVKGKDVGRYSEKDMNCIFATKQTNMKPVAALIETSITNINSTTSENSVPESLPTFKSQLSMNDYFALKLKKKSEECSKVEASDSQDAGELCHTNEVVSKKRKKKLKNNSKKSKKIKLEQSVDSPDSSSGTPKKTSKLADKLENLKSCLKKKFGSNLWIKQEKKEVSFNDSISYKIIENVLNGDDVYNEADANSLECSEEDTVDEFTAEADDCNIEQSSDGKDKPAHMHNAADVRLDERTQGSCDENGGDCPLDCYEGDMIDNCTVEENGCFEGDSIDECAVEEVGCVAEPSSDSPEETDVAVGDADRPKCFDLPKCDNLNYNTWLESQRIAIKMKHYKNMVKKIRKHPVLRTSNLLDIKGYGNWGF